MELINDISTVPRSGSGGHHLHHAGPRVRFAELKQLRRSKRSARSRGAKARLHHRRAPGPRALETDAAPSAGAAQPLSNARSRSTDTGRASFAMSVAERLLLALPPRARVSGPGHQPRGRRQTGTRASPRAKALYHLLGCSSQCRGTTTRKYGALPFALSISRDIANLLGVRDILLESEPVRAAVHPLPSARLRGRSRVHRRSSCRRRCGPGPAAHLAQLPMPCRCRRGRCTPCPIVSPTPTAPIDDARRHRGFDRRRRQVLVVMTEAPEWRRLPSRARAHERCAQVDSLSASADAAK